VRIVAALGLLTTAEPAVAYPPGVGILTKNRSCLSCHVANGPWSDETRTIVDVLDAGTKQSLRTSEGRFVIEVPRGRTRRC
jgi:hypothetical protein